MDQSFTLDHYLTQLRLSTVREQYRHIAQEAIQGQFSYERFLAVLLEQELLAREQHRYQQAIKAAQFPVLKELADFDFSLVPSVNKQLVFDLAQGHYQARAEAIVLVGNPGLGKTHVATGLALAACRQGHRVRFYTAASLVNDLLAAQAAHRLDRVLRQALKHQVVVLDEFGFIPFTALGAQLLFQFCSTLYERVSLIVTTNLRFADWPQVLGDERLTAALLDRLTHKGHVLEFVGESFRFRQRLQRNPVLSPIAAEPHEAGV